MLSTKGSHSGAVPNPQLFSGRAEFRDARAWKRSTNPRGPLGGHCGDHPSSPDCFGGCGPRGSYLQEPGGCPEHHPHGDRS